MLWILNCLNELVLLSTQNTILNRWIRKYSQFHAKNVLNLTYNGCMCIFQGLRAYPGSEFVVENTLAKWKKLEPSEINFIQGLSQKVVSTSYFVFKSLLARGDLLSADNFCKQFGPRYGPTRC